jgi:hypothetical protein
MYTLIGSPKSRGFRVMWMLEEAGQDYEVVAAAAGSEEARNYNPSGKIPALVVDDKVIIDSVAICQFIADRHKVCTYEAGTIERAGRTAGCILRSTSLIQPAGGRPSTVSCCPKNIALRMRSRLANTIFRVPWAGWKSASAAMIMSWETSSPCRTC